MGLPGNRRLSIASVTISPTATEKNTAELSTQKGSSDAT